MIPSNSISLCVTVINIGTHSINVWMVEPSFVCLMMLNATFNNISVISWWRVLIVVETGVPGENHHWQTLSHNVAHLALIEIRTHNISGDMHWLIGYVVINPTTIRSRPRRPLAVTMTNGNYSGNMWHMFVTGRWDWHHICMIKNNLTTSIFMS